MAGGQIILRYRTTKAWGVGPASANVTYSAAGDAPPVSVGGDARIVFPSPDGTRISFTGVVQRVDTRTDTKGDTWEVVVVDDRIHLKNAWVFGAWNIENPEWSRGSTHPLNERRRYYSVYPEDWAAGKRTYHQTPLTAQVILQKARSQSVGASPPTFSMGGLLNTAVFGIDAMRGMSLANLISSINSALGINCYLQPGGSLHFDKKGGGGGYVEDKTHTVRKQIGTALISAPTRMRLVGDQNLVQTIVTLEPDWNNGWEDWLSEPAWHAKVGEALGLPSTTRADYAERAVQALQVTVAEFAEAVGNKALLDDRSWGEISRNDMPAWLYINDIVFKAYRIPRDYKLFGVPLDSLRLHPGLIVGCQLASESSGGIKLRSPDPKYYPDGKAFVVANGQPIDVIDPETGQIFIKHRTVDVRNRYSVVSGFDLDPVSETFIFDSPILVPGKGKKDLFLYPNREVSGVKSGTDYHDLVVPNPDFEAEPATVKACVTFQVGQFYHEKGSGSRIAARYEAGLSMHLIDTALGSGLGEVTESVPETWNVREIPMHDGQTAFDLAEKLVDSGLATSDTETSGAITRHGKIGYRLSPSVDRVTIDVSERGFVETINMEHPAPTKGFVSEKSLERQAASKDLFPNDREHRRQIRLAEALARMEKTIQHKPRKNPRTHDATKKVINNPHAGETYIPFYDDGDGSAQAGEVIWLNAQDKPDPSGKKFGGVMITDTANGADAAYVATQGVVPVKVRGPIVPGDSVGCDPGENVCIVDGERHVGIINHGESFDGEETLLAYVKLHASNPARPQFAIEPILVDDAFTSNARIHEGILLAAIGADAPVDPTAIVEITGGLPQEIPVSIGQGIYIRCQWSLKTQEVRSPETETVSEANQWALDEASIEAAGEKPEVEVDWEAGSAVTFIEIGQLLANEKDPNVPRVEQNLKNTVVAQVGIYPDRDSLEEALKKLRGSFVPENPDPPGLSQWVIEDGMTQGLVWVSDVTMEDKVGSDSCTTVKVYTRSLTLEHWRNAANPNDPLLTFVNWDDGVAATEADSEDLVKCTALVPEAPVPPSGTKCYYRRRDYLDTIADWAEVPDTLVELNTQITDAVLIDTGDPRLSDDRAPLAHTHLEADITDLGTATTLNADTNLSANAWMLDEDTMVSDDATKVPSQQSVKAYVDNAVTGAYNHQGGYDAATNTPDLDTSPSGINKGYAYKVTVAGTFFTKSVMIGDTIIADQDDPTAEGHWTCVQANVDAATTDTLGLVELATNGEVAANVVVQGNDSRLSDARTPTAHTHPVAELSNASTDGRDLITRTSTSMRELLNVEDGATADQTGTEIENAYNTAVSQVTLGEITAASVTSTRRHSPADVKEYINQHGVDITTLVKLNAIVGDATLIDTLDPRLSDARTPIAHTHLVEELSNSSTDGKNLIKAMDYATMLTLLGIEPGATADQTNIEIADAYTAVVGHVTGTEITNATVTSPREHSPFDIKSYITQHGATGDLSTTDIDTLVKLNAIVGDATLIDTLDPRFSDARTPLAHTHSVADLSNATTDGKNILTAVDYAAMRLLLNIEDGAKDDQTDTEIETAYHAVVDKVLIGEIINPIETSTRRYSPVDIKSFITNHAVTPDQLTAYLPLWGGTMSGALNMDGFNIQNVGQIIADELILAGANGLITFKADTRITFNPGASEVGLNVGSVNGDPSSRVSGDIWYETDEGEMSYVEGGVTKRMASKADISNNVALFFAHIFDFANPHAVTKAQVLLGNVDDTSDLDKPISTSVQAALDGKLAGTDIDSLVKLNAIVTTPDLIDTSDPRLSDARTPTAHSHPASEISDASAVGQSVLKSANYTSMRGLLNVADGATADQTPTEIKDAFTSVVPQITALERTNGTETSVRQVSPFDLKDFVTTHAPGGLTGSDIDSLVKLNAIVTTPDLIDTSDSRLSDARTPTTHSHPASQISDASADGRTLLKSANYTSMRGLLNVADGATNFDGGDINTFAKLDGFVGDATLIKSTDSRLSDARTPTAHSHPASQISDASADGRTFLKSANYTSMRGLLNVEDGATNFDGGDINTFAKLDGFVGDATLIKSTDSRLSDARTPLSHTHTVAQLSNATTDGKNIITAANYTAMRVLLNVDDGATANSSDITLKSRSNHTGTQTLTTISDNGTAAYYDVPAFGNASLGEVVKGSDSRLSDARTPLTHSHAVSDLSNASPDGRSLITQSYTSMRESLNVEDGATQNADDSTLVNRLYHTGTQTLATISDSGTAAALNVAASGDASSGEVVKGNDSRLTNARTPTTHTHTVSQLSDASSDGRFLIKNTYTSMKELLSLDLVNNLNIPTPPGSGAGMLKHTSGTLSWDPV